MVPNPPSQPSNLPYPAGVAGNPATPSSPPIGSSAAATCTSAWVSTPPVTARVTCDGQRHPFLRLRDGTHPLAARTLGTPASCPGQADQTGSAGGCQKPGPGRQIVSQDSQSGVSRLAGQAGTQATDPTPPLTENLGGGTGALPTSSLPTRSGLVSNSVLSRRPPRSSGSG